MKLSPYPQYKDSGIKWIGKIPERWDADRLKFLVSKINSGLTPKGGARVYTNEGIPLLRSQNIHFDGLRLDDVAYIPDEIHQTMLNSVVRVHDILINITGASIGRCTHVEEEFDKANVNQHVCIIRPKEIFYRYLSYYLRSRLGQDQVFSVQMGTSREGLNFEQLGNFIIFHPNKEDQQRIVHYLDKQTSKIDKTIQKDRQLIELLKEKRTALINHVVTKGLDPNVKMKDSGIKWIGKIPERWEASLIKYKLLKITDGSHISPELDNGIHYFISTVDVKNGKIDFNNCLLTSEENYLILKYQGCKPLKGDVLYSKDGTIGETALVEDDKEFVVASSLIIMRPNQKLVYPNYLNYLLQTSLVFDKVMSFIKGSALNRISLTNIKRVYGIFPSIVEQRNISKYLDKQTSKIDKTIQKIEKKIELLEEYKRSLINHVITGKIDVRSVAA